MSSRCWLLPLKIQNQDSNLMSLSWFCDDKRGKHPWCLTSSAGVKNAARWQGSKIPGWCLLPPFEVGPTEISEHGGSLNHRIFTGSHIPDCPNLEGQPEFTFSETQALPKETESMQLKLLGGNKRRVISASLSPSLHCCVCQWHNGHGETLIFILKTQNTFCAPL